MKKCFKGFAIAVFAMLLLSISAHAYNEKVKVDINDDAAFGEEPPDPNVDDKITVTTPEEEDRDIEITDYSVTDDPRGGVDKAKLIKTSNNTLDVIRRGGVGALYEIEGKFIVEKEENGEEGEIPTWWAEVEDTIFEEPDLYLQDDETTDYVKHEGDEGPAYPLYCKADDEKKGKVNFWLDNVEEGTYNWLVPGGDSGMLTGPGYADSLSEIDPGEYTLEVTGDDNDFDRDIEFVVISLEIEGPDEISLGYTGKITANILPEGIEGILLWGLDTIFDPPETEISWTSDPNAYVKGLFPTEQVEDDPKIRFQFRSWDSENQEFIFKFTSNWHEFTVTGGIITTYVEPGSVFAGEEVEVTGKLWEDYYDNEESYGYAMVEFFQSHGDAVYQEESGLGDHTAKVNHETKDPWVPHPDTGRLGHKEFRADALGYAPFHQETKDYKYYVKGVKVQGFTLTTNFGTETFPVDDIAIYNPKQFAIEYLKDYAIDAVADNTIVVDELKEIIDKANQWISFVSWFDKSYLGLTSVGQFIWSVDMEVDFEAVTSDGVWIEDTTIVTKTPDDLSQWNAELIQWNNPSNISVIIALYLDLIMETADQVVDDAEYIFDNY